MAQQVQISLGYEVKTDSNDVQSGAATVVDTTSVTARIGGRRSIVPLANVAIPFDGVTTSSILVVRASGAVNVRFDAVDADPVAVTPVSSGQEAVLAATASAAGVWVENPSATASVEVTWLLAGA